MSGAMGTRSNDDHHQPQPGDMDPTERLLAAFRNIAIPPSAQPPADPRPDYDADPDDGTDPAPDPG